MPSRKSISSYHDCFALMDKVLEQGNGTMAFESKAKASAFRHRCYRARARMADRVAAETPSHMIPWTKYDDIYIVHDADDPARLRIRLRSLEPAPDFQPDEPVRERDQFEEAARNLKFDLDL